MDKSSNLYNSTNYSQDMRSGMAKSLDKDTDLARSYSNMDFVNREEILPHEKCMGTIRGQKLADWRKIQEMKDIFDEDRAEMLDLRDYKEWIKEQIMCGDIELSQEFERIKKFRKKLNNMYDGLQQETEGLEADVMEFKEENDDLRRRINLLAEKTKRLEDGSYHMKNTLVAKKNGKFRDTFFEETFNSGINDMHKMYLGR